MRLSGIFLILILLTGCASDTPEPVEPGPGDRDPLPPQSAVIGFSDQPGTIDPAAAVTAVDVTLVSALYTGLLRPDDRNSPVGCLADRWEFNPETSTWVFELVPGLAWSNGQPLTATDVQQSWLRLLDPANPSPHAHHLHQIRGATAYASGAAPADSVMIRAVNDHTLEVTVDQYCWFPAVTAVPALYPTPGGNPPELTANTPVSGPFMISAVTGTSVQLKPNSGYRQMPDVETVTVTGEFSRDHIVAAVINRDLDAAIAPVPATHLSHLDRAGLLRTRSEPATCYLLVNTLNPPLTDPRVRQALTLGIDRSHLGTYVTRGGEQPAMGFVPPGLPCPSGGEYRTHTGGLLPDYHPDRAQALLAETGAGPGHTLNLLINTSARNRAVAGFLSRSYSDLGLPLTITEVDTGTYLRLRAAGEFDLARAGREAVSPDPLSLLILMTAGHSHNVTGWSHPGFDRALFSPDTSDPDEFARRLRLAERILIGDAPIIPLQFYAGTWLQHQHIHGLIHHPVGPGISLEHIRLSVPD